MGKEGKESRWEVKFSSSSRIDLSGALLEDFCLRSVVELVLCKLPPLRQAHQGQLLPRSLEDQRFSEVRTPTSPPILRARGPDLRARTELSFPRLCRLYVLSAFQRPNTPCHPLWHLEGMYPGCSEWRAEGRALSFGGPPLGLTPSSLCARLGFEEEYSPRLC